MSCWGVKTVSFFYVSNLPITSVLPEKHLQNAVVHFWAYLDIQTLLSEPCHYEKNTAGRSARIYKKQDRTEKNIEAKRIMIAAFQELFNEKKKIHLKNLPHLFQFMISHDVFSPNGITPTDKHSEYYKCSWRANRCEFIINHFRRDNFPQQSIWRSS